MSIEMVTARPSEVAVTGPVSTDATGQRRRGAIRWHGQLRAPVAALAGVGLLIGVWSALYAARLFPPVLFPSVPAIGRAGAAMWADGTLQADVLASMGRAVKGFAIGGVAGILVGTFTACTRIGQLILQPVLRLFAPIPTIALIPLAILWLGLGEASKLFMVALGVFVPVWINTHSGVSTTPRDYLQVTRCVGASRWQRLSRVILPEALPDIVIGLRVGTATAFVLIVVAELTGTTAGLGYRISQAQLFSQADRLLFCLVVLGILGAACDQFVARVSDPWTRWARAEQ